MSISQETIDSIRQRVNIADLIGETVQLKRTGRNLVGLCPFHAEKTPSFSVNPDDGFFHCFGCSKHGSVFDFVMETRGLTFVEAVKFLGARVGIEVRSESPERNELRKREEERRKLLRSVLREVVQCYQEQLAHPQVGQTARRYLTERGVSAESIRLFQVGYCPENQSHLEELLKRVAPHAERAEREKALIELGVCGKRDDGTIYETFRGRIIFPILRSDGVPVALGGRILESQSNRPKYINSKESPIYQKRQTLYGLSHALPYLRREREAILVEGYMDVIALAQAGFPSAVATCGTSVTPEHVELLRRFCEKLICVFDADPAGQKAAANCFELFLNSGIEVFGLSLPNNEDPGSFLIGKRARKLGENVVQREFEELLAQSRKSILKVYLDYHLGETDRGAAALGRLSEDFVRVSRKTKNPVEREALLREGSQILGVSFDSLKLLERSSQPKQAPREASPRQESPRPAAPPKAPPRPSPRPVVRPNMSSQRVSGYLEQMLISVICAPSLSSSLLDLEHSLKELASETFPLERLLRILRNIDSGDFVALDNFRGREKSAEFAEYISRWRTLLEAEGLDSKKLLSASWHQIKVGGAAPEKLVLDAERVHRENSIHAQVEKLRDLEREVPDGDKRQELIQRKLLEKRTLHETQKRSEH